MTEQWIGDILDGVATIVVLLLILLMVVWYYARRILQELQQIGRRNADSDDD